MYTSYNWVKFYQTAKKENGVLYRRSWLSRKQCLPPGSGFKTEHVWFSHKIMWSDKDLFDRIAEKWNSALFLCSIFKSHANQFTYHKICMKPVICNQSHAKIAPCEDQFLLVSRTGQSHRPQPFWIPGIWSRYQAVHKHWPGCQTDPVRPTQFQITAKSAPAERHMPPGVRNSNALYSHSEI